MAFSWPYRQHSHMPYWGPSNSQANFCEEDYIVTPYVGELVNTVSNLVYLFYALHGLQHTTSILHRLPYVGLSLVGIGSAFFHASLKNYTQWCDELSMLIATSAVLHRMFTFDQSMQITLVSGVAMALGMAGFIGWHCWVDETTLHSILFGVMIVIVGIKTRSTILLRVPDPETRRQVKKMATWGAAFFVTGFLIWNIDNATCATLTRTKRAIGMPWSFLLELHGWWHIFTGVGAYTFMALAEYLTSSSAGCPLSDHFAWPVGYFVCTINAKDRYGTDKVQSIKKDS